MKRYALIGSGMMGQEHLKNLALLSGVEVTHVYEPDLMMQARTRALVPKVTFCQDIGALLAAAPDAIVIASPNYCHAEQLAEIVAYGRVPVLVEKPVCVNHAQLQQVASIAANQPWWVAMEYRYMPPIAKLIEIVRSGAVGRVQMMTIREHRYPFLEKVGHWNRFNRNTGGTLVEKCCHFFDLMRLIIGANPVRVMATGGQAVNHLDELYPEGVPDILDHAYVLVDFEAGQKACLELSMFTEGSEYQELISVVGEQGKVEALVPGPTRFWQGAAPAPEPKVVLSPRNGQRPEVFETPVDSTLLAAGDHNGSTYFQHARFLDSLENGQIEVTVDDGCWAVRMGLAAHESIAQARVIPMGSPV